MTDVFYSEVDGMTVAWDMCGACRRHVTRCGCEGGPVPPGYLVEIRAVEPAPEATEGTAPTVGHAA